MSSIDLVLFVVLVLTLAGAAALARGFGPAGAVLTRLGGREPQIDGLRGMCALWVALHHLVFVGYWKISLYPPSLPGPVASSAGKVGVAMFFLICAYLFWGRLSHIGTRGWRGWLSFLDNRVRRIVPMYLVAMSAALALGLASRTIDAWLPWQVLLRQGAKAYTFWFFPAQEFNHSTVAKASLGLAWTLSYEWLFYASLPLLALFRFRRLWPVFLPGLLLVNETLARVGWVEYFIYGCVVRELSTLPWVRRAARSSAGAWLSIGLVLGTAYWVDAEGLAIGWPALALSAAFLVIVAGNDWFGILTSRGARLVGAASYSVYLLNIVVEWPAVQILPGTPVLWSAAGQVLGMTAIALLLVVVSLWTYRFVELPFQRSHRSEPFRIRGAVPGPLATVGAPLQSGQAGRLRARLGVLSAGAVLAVSFGLGTAFDFRVAEIWSLFGVEHEGIAFLDLAMITGAADCAARGINPYLTPSCDILQRVYNYPPILLLLADLGLRSVHTVPLGLVLDALFFAAMIVVLKARSRTGQVIIFLAVLSYPVLWGLQRGNIDLAVFIGCVAACLLLGRAGSWPVARQLLAAGILLLLFLAKLYPVAACTAFWRDRRSIMAACVIATVAVVAYVAADPAMFAAVRALTPFITERSYGVGVLAGLVYFKATDAVLTLGEVPPQAQLVSYWLGGLGLVGAVLLSLRCRRAISSMFDLQPSLALRLALVGLSVYCMTYCLGTNFNYRLGFLVLAVPYFVSGWEQRRSAASLGLALATVAFLWLKWQTHNGFGYQAQEVRPLIAEGVGFILFVIYAIGLFSMGLNCLSSERQAGKALSTD